MTIDLDALERLARAATPGPWHTGDGYEQQDPGAYVADARGHIVVAQADDSPCVPTDAAFIAAANPAAVLELVQRLRATENLLHDGFAFLLKGEPRSPLEADIKAILLRRAVEAMKP